jgi:hypothetical protein
MFFKQNFKRSIICVCNKMLFSKRQKWLKNYIATLEIKMKQNKYKIYISNITTLDLFKKNTNSLYVLIENHRNPNCHTQNGISAINYTYLLPCWQWMKLNIK